MRMEGGAISLGESLRHIRWEYRLESFTSFCLTVRTTKITVNLDFYHDERLARFTAGQVTGLLNIKNVPNHLFFILSRTDNEDLSAELGIFIRVMRRLCTTETAALSTEVGGKWPFFFVKKWPKKIAPPPARFLGAGPGDCAPQAKNFWKQSLKRLKGVYFGRRLV